MVPVKANRIGAWIVIAVLITLLVMALAFLYVGWDTASDPAAQQMSASGYAAMAFGIIATMSLGFGLMALVFYSNRKGHDQNANIERKK